MNPQNSLQANRPESHGSPTKGSQIASGVLIGIFQTVFMVILYFSFNVTVSPYISRLFGGLGDVAVVFLFALLPFILEVIFLRKTKPYLIRGAIIGAILVPLIGFGACLFLLRGL